MDFKDPVCVITLLGISLTAWVVFQYSPVICRFYNFLTMFHREKIVENFRTMSQQGCPTRVVHRGHDVSQFDETEVNKYDLPETFTTSCGKVYNTVEFLEQHWTTGLVVLKIESDTKAKLVYEHYFRGQNVNTTVISWSTAKSITSALIGIALNEGKIKSLDDVVTEYVPSLWTSGYNNVKIKDVLQMSSGIRFNEDYFNIFSDINRLGLVLSLGKSLDEFIGTLKNQVPPGSYHNYVSSDTQVLGMVLRNAVGCSLSQYLEEKLWKPMGCQSDAYWLLDNEVNQMELAFGGFNAVTRDFARFGWLYLNNGRSPLNNSQLIDAGYVKASVTPDADHLMPDTDSLRQLGYAYQWWIPVKEGTTNEIDDDYLAIGVYNQFIYVSPRHKIVIARNSAYPNYDTDNIQSEVDAVACFRTMAQHFSKLS